MAPILGFRSGLLAGILLASFLLSSVWIFLGFNYRQSPPASLGNGDRAVIELTLDRYKTLARNMTVRLETAEHSVQQLRQESVKLTEQQRQRLKKEKEKAQMISAKRSSTTTETSTENPEAEPQEEEETDEEKTKRLADEEREQRALIKYDEAMGTFRRWRGDFKCGGRVPLLPDGEAVECEPGFTAPCCSGLGWCGRSEAHCLCDMCTDYSTTVKVSFDSLKLYAAKRECETIADNLGDLATPEECAKKAIQHMECGNRIMFSRDYPYWGCRCCSLDTPPTEEVKDAWSVYEFSVKVTPKG